MRMHITTKKPRVAASLMPDPGRFPPLSRSNSSAKPNPGLRPTQGVKLMAWERLAGVLSCSSFLLCRHCFQTLHPGWCLRCLSDSLLTSHKKHLSHISYVCPAFHCSIYSFKKLIMLVMYAYWGKLGESENYKKEIITGDIWHQYFSRLYHLFVFSRS